MSLQFAIVKREVTPRSHLPMGGYGARIGVAEGVLDPLYCRAAVLSDAGATTAFVVLDWVYVSKPWADSVRLEVAGQLGCPVANVLVAATHTHAGPAVFRSELSLSDEMRSYESDAAAVVLEAVEKARSGRRTAVLSRGRVEVRGVAANRGDPSRNASAGVDVLVARDPSGECIGSMASFGCHPTVLPPSNLFYSADLFGAAIAAAEQRLGAPVMLCNGAAGDISTRFTRLEQTAAEMRRLASILGEGIVRAVEAAAPMTYRPLYATSEHVPIALRSLPSVDEAKQRVAQAGSELERIRSRGSVNPDEERLAASRLEGAFGQLLLATEGGVETMLGRVPADAELQVLEIGDADVIAVPGEVFSGVADEIRKARRRPGFIVGYANDYLGYLVPSEVTSTGYETLMAVIDPASVDALTERLCEISCE